MKPHCLDCKHRIGHSCYRHPREIDPVTKRSVVTRVTACREERRRQNVAQRFLSAIGFEPSRCGKRGRYFKAKGTAA